MLRDRLISYYQRRLIDHPTIFFFSTKQASEPAYRDDLIIRSPNISELRQLLQKTSGVPNQDLLYQQRYQAGDWACTVYRDDELVHISWAGYRKDRIAADYELGHCGNWQLTSKAGLIYDCWTSPSARGLGIYPYVLCHLQNKLLALAPSVWIYCLSRNHASQRGIEKAGFHLQGKRQAWRVMGHFFACGS